MHVTLRSRTQFNQRGLLESDWLWVIQEISRPSLWSATKEKIGFVKVVSVRVRREYICIRVLFGIVRSLTVPFLPITTFLEILVIGIFPPENKNVLYSSVLVPIIAAVIKTKCKQKRRTKSQHVQSGCSSWKRTQHPSAYTRGDKTDNTTAAGGLSTSFNGSRRTSAG